MWHLSALCFSSDGETMYARSLLGWFTQLVMGGRCRTQSDRSRKKSPCVSKLYDGFLPGQHHFILLLLLLAHLNLDACGLFHRPVPHWFFPIYIRRKAESKATLMKYQRLQRWDGKPMDGSLNLCENVKPLRAVVMKGSKHYSLTNLYHAVILNISLWNQIEHQEEKRLPRWLTEMSIRRGMSVEQATNKGNHFQIHVFPGNYILS